MCLSTSECSLGWLIKLPTLLELTGIGASAAPVMGSSLPINGTGNKARPRPSHLLLSLCMLHLIPLGMCSTKRCCKKKKKN